MPHEAPASRQPPRAAAWLPKGCPRWAVSALLMPRKPLPDMTVSVVRGACHLPGSLPDSSRSPPGARPPPHLALAPDRSVCLQMTCPTYTCGSQSLAGVTQFNSAPGPVTGGAPLPPRKPPAACHPAARGPSARGWGSFTRKRGEERVASCLSRPRPPGNLQSVGHTRGVCGL